MRDTLKAVWPSLQSRIAYRLPHSVYRDMLRYAPCQVLLEGLGRGRRWLMMAVTPSERIVTP